ncbi:uncharacterized protein LOC110834387 isoform X1 [Zootermopsis nevadensis]|uniref:uncharacterized protein LOC110834387 isoform X1 n=1 Tax=Zootermopsis nevadensis TaxID=136037 RepID=UPI000B8E9417|nr:uncharacterized protein LOC110834387 isoform X1 [Zootermopsis nevadensis]
MCDSAALRPWKRSRSDPDLDRWSSSQSELKRRRGSKSAEDVRQCTRDVAQSPNPPHGETDARDLLQLALDRICELQRKLMQRGTCAAGGPVEEFTGQSSDSEDDFDDEDDDENYSEANNSFHDREIVLAGYEFCHKEALRFLVEEEHLGPEHPAVRELTAHLSSRRNTIDCSQVLANYLMLSSPSADSINV